MNDTFKPRQILAGTVFAMLASAAAVPRAQAADPDKPMALQAVMEKLGQDMQAITGAISREDWTLVAELAPKISRHAAPPLGEKMRILAWLGSDAGKFRGFDGQVNDAANGIGEAATRGDGHAVITAFSKVQQACLSCHQNFRESFAKHFYKEN